MQKGKMAQAVAAVTALLLVAVLISFYLSMVAVSYTHLDVYKRQPLYFSTLTGPLLALCSRFQAQYMACLLYTSRCV